MLIAPHVYRYSHIHIYFALCESIQFGKERGTIRVRFGLLASPIHGLPSGDRLSLRPPACRSQRLKQICRWPECALYRPVGSMSKLSLLPLKGGWVGKKRRKHITLVALIAYVRCMYDRRSQQNSVGIEPTKTKASSPHISEVKIKSPRTIC